MNQLLRLRNRVSSEVHKNSYFCIMFTLKGKTTAYFVKYIQEHMDESHEMKTQIRCIDGCQCLRLYIYAPDTRRKPVLIHSNPATQLNFNVNASLKFAITSTVHFVRTLIHEHPVSARDCKHIISSHKMDI